MKKIRNLPTGSIFYYAGEKFVVLDQMTDGVFCLLEQSKKKVPYNRGGDSPNDYRYASLRQEIEDIWMQKLIENGARYGDMVRFNVDLRTTDLSEGYGTLGAVYSAPLTLWQYGKYKDIIPFNEDGAWWLVTPWACRWSRSPYTDLSGVAWLVAAKGDADVNHCPNTYGIRPALKLNPELLVSIDGESEKEGGCGRCDNYCVDLGRVDTLTMIREVERRISEMDSCTAQNKKNTVERRRTNEQGT